MEAESEYGDIIVCDKCNQACGINGYGDWHEVDISKEEEGGEDDKYNHLCPDCYKEICKK